MQLQKTKAMKSRGKQYYKYMIIVPYKLVSNMGLEGGEKLRGCVREGKLIIEFDDSKPKGKLSYDEFRDLIKTTLENDFQLTWDELRTKAKIKLKSPNQKWVNQLKTDIGLKIIIEGGQKFWILEDNDENGL